ncbi:hypothetical protein [Rhizobium ruizarguesonis]|uniref:hypothetical protein n=2 Tax=Rhizobium ruizarguesonis TaxID=2081791 RepID=UPI00102F3196|nr:hypothetical protein [Rhizobium ruizarguesonis]TBE96816.1 hypothetical protein ELG98_09595 [Rhizobium ruizarguesonis]
MMRTSLAIMFAPTMLLYADAALSASAPEKECFQQVEFGAKPGAWEQIKAYLVSLNPISEPEKPISEPEVPRSRLTELRAEIIRFERVKQHLIEIIEAHINTRSSGSEVAENLRLSGIPVLLRQLHSIAERLNTIAQDGDMFAAQDAFRQLAINIDDKRADIICKLAVQAASPNPDIPAMKALVGKLKAELNDISAAEEALGKYLRENNQ